jgi:hypothetical protein
MVDLLTKNDAVNIALRSIGQTSVTWADVYGGPSANPDDNEISAIECVGMAMREFAMRTEWVSNMRGDRYYTTPYKITADSSGNVVLPSNTVRAILHPNDPRYKTIDVVEKTDTSDSNKLKLFNLNGQTTVPGDGTFNFGAGSVVQLQLTLAEDFHGLTAAARMWVAHRAALLLMARKQYDNQALLSQNSNSLALAERTLQVDNETRHPKTMLDSPFMYQATRRYFGNLS